MDLSTRARSAGAEQPRSILKRPGGSGAVVATRKVRQNAAQQPRQAQQADLPVEKRLEDLPPELQTLVRTEHQRWDHEGQTATVSVPVSDAEAAAQRILAGSSVMRTQLRMEKQALREATQPAAPALESECITVSVSVCPAAEQPVGLSEEALALLAASERTSSLPRVDPWKSRVERAATAADSNNRLLLQIAASTEGPAGQLRRLLLGSTRHGGMQQVPMTNLCKLAEVGDLFAAGATVVMQLPSGLHARVTRLPDPWEEVEVLVSGVPREVALDDLAGALHAKLSRNPVAFVLREGAPSVRGATAAKTGSELLGIVEEHCHAGGGSSGASTVPRRDLVLVVRRDKLQQVPAVLMLRFIRKDGSEGHAKVKLTPGAGENTALAGCHNCGSLQHYAAKCNANLARCGVLAGCAVVPRRKLPEAARAACEGEGSDGFTVVGNGNRQPVGEPGRQQQQQQQQQLQPQQPRQQQQPKQSKQSKQPKQPKQQQQQSKKQQQPSERLDPDGALPAAVLAESERVALREAIRRAQAERLEMFQAQLNSCLDTISSKAAEGPAQARALLSEFEKEEVVLVAAHKTAQGRVTSQVSKRRKKKKKATRILPEFESAQDDECLLSNAAEEEASDAYSFLQKARNLIVTLRALVNLIPTTPELSVKAEASAELEQQRDGLLLARRDSFDAADDIGVNADLQRQAASAQRAAAGTAQPLAETPMLSTVQSPLPDRPLTETGSVTDVDAQSSCSTPRHDEEDPDSGDTPSQLSPVILLHADQSPLQDSTQAQRGSVTDEDADEDVRSCCSSQHHAEGDPNCCVALPAGQLGSVEDRQQAKVQTTPVARRLRSACSLKADTLGSVNPPSLQ